MVYEIKDVIDDILANVPGVIGVILIDIDGIPISISGRFDLPPEELGAFLAACFSTYVQLGEDIGQDLATIITEYNNLKLYQLGMPRGGLIIVASKEAYLGMIRLEGKRAIAKLSNMMAASAKGRQNMMNNNKLRRPDAKEIEDVLSKFI